MTSSLRLLTRENSDAAAERMLKVLRESDGLVDVAAYKLGMTRQHWNRLVLLLDGGPGGALRRRINDIRDDAREDRRAKSPNNHVFPPGGSSREAFLKKSKARANARGKGKKR